MDSQTINQKMETFLKMMTEDHAYLCPSLDFSSICRLIGARENLLNQALMDNIGISGEALIAQYRSSYMEYLGNKYHLDIAIAR